MPTSRPTWLSTILVSGNAAARLATSPSCGCSTKASNVSPRRPSNANPSRNVLSPSSPGGGGVRIEDRLIGVPGRAIAQAAEAFAAGARKRIKHRFDAAAQPQIGEADDTGRDPGLAAISAGADRRHAVDEFGFADRAHLDRTGVPVHRVRLHEYGGHDIVAGTGIGQKVVQHVAPAGPHPEVVMRVDDRQFGLQRGLLAPRQPIVAHRARRHRA